MSIRLSRLLGALCLLAGAFDAAAVTATAGQIIISEFRVRGPSGATDEYIVLHNTLGTSHTVLALSGTGYGVASSDGVTRCSIPNGTIIPAKGHYLCTNSGAYSLGGYATGDATFVTDIPDNAGIAIFNNNTGGGSYSVANRLDAVGSTSEANTTYKEGTGYPALTPFSIDYAFYRDLCGKSGSITTLGTCPAFAVYKDTDNNAADFIFVDTNGTSAGAGQRLGSPGPQNLASPIGGNVAGMAVALLDTCVTEAQPANRERDLTSVPAQNSTFGTIDHRYTVTNSTGGNITSLRFRVVDLTTFPAPSGFADLRPRTSPDLAVLVDRPPCLSGTSSPTVRGTTLEQPPSQPNGGGFNSTMNVAAVTGGTPLANGASIDVRLLFGIQQTGTYKFALIVETLPAGSATHYFECHTESSTCTAPSVLSSVRVNPSPTNLGSVQYTVTFDQSVSGVDTTDFALTTTGTIAGASVTGVTAGPASVYTVTVNTGTGSGTLRLDVVDDDTINSGIPLGGPGAGNGSFITGEVYSIDKTAPTVTINQAVGQLDPASTAPINFTVVFSEVITGFTAADISFAGSTAGGVLAAVVSGAGPTYNVAVSGMTTPGNVLASVVAGAATDAVGNLSLVSTSADNTVAWVGVDVTPPTVTINQAVGQADPTLTAPINFTVVFSEVVTGFTAADISFAGSTVGGVLAAVVSGAGPTYNVAVSGMTTAGIVQASIPAAAAIDGAANPSLASTSADNQVTWAPDVTSPTVTINQAGGQLDPATTAPINFTVVFSENVTGFTAADILFTGSTAPGTLTPVVTGGPATYNVAVSGMTGNGTVVASIPAAAAIDGASNASLASTSADNSVTFNGFAVTAFTAPSATGTGSITAAFVGGGAGCSFGLRQYILGPPGGSPVPPTVPPDSSFFPHGMFTFTTTGCTPGSTLAFTITYPSALPPGTQYWKYGPAPGDPSQHWYVLPATIVGNVITFSITDGGLGDDDLLANGTIVDQGGPGVPPGAVAGGQIPTLSEWGLILLGLLLLAFSTPALQRRR